MRQRNNRPIDVTPFKEAALHKFNQGESWSNMCRRVEWTTYNKTKRPDTTRIQRVLGIKPSVTSKSKKVKEYTYYAKTMSYKQALVVCHALDVDPVDFGL